MISTKKAYVKTDGWRGYYKPIYGVVGASDTGSWSDSPAPTRRVVAEIAKAGSILRRNGIKYKQVHCRSSNVFMMKRWLCVAEQDMDKAKEALKELVDCAGYLHF